MRVIGIQMAHVQTANETFNHQFTDSPTVEIIADHIQLHKILIFYFKVYYLVVNLN